MSEALEKQKDQTHPPSFLSSHLTVSNLRERKINMT